MAVLPTARAANGSAWVKSDDSSDFGNIADAVTGAIFFDAVDHLHASGGIEEVGGANLHSCRSGHNKLEGVARIGDAAEAHYRYRYRFSYLPYHAYGHRANCRSRQTSGDCRQHRSAMLYVDSHTQQCVDE